MTRMWMVRGESGSLYDAFREREVVAVGWIQLAPPAKPGIRRKELIATYQPLEPQLKKGSVVAGATRTGRAIRVICLLVSAP